MFDQSEDYLQDVVFDYYGSKMAVCSSDRKIKIYEKNENEGSWDYITDWEAHDAPVWKLQWAHPEFGVILASCGFDKRVNIWQEKKEDGKINWTSRAKIQDFSDSVEDISFCPKVHGLKIAATTLNGKMKIFEPTDYANNINWNCISTKDVSSVGCSSVCWNPSSIDPQTLVVGCHFDSKKNNQQDLIQLYAYIDSKKEYSLICNFQNGHSNSVTDVEWAPQFGRSFHLIASCSIDKSLIIWKLNLKYAYNNEHFDNISADVENLFRFTNDSPIWRLSWNLSGTLLTCIDDNGKTQLFKKTDEKSFEIINLSHN